MSAASFADDFRPTDLVMGVATALVVLVGGAIAIQATSLSGHGNAAEIEKGMSTPVRVIPVLDVDTPLLKLGGKKPKLPEKWIRQAPAPVLEERVVVTTKAGKTADDVPDKQEKLLDAGLEAPPPDAAVAKQVDTPIEEAADSGPAPTADGPGSPNGSKEGTETDPLKAHVADQYRARVAGWLTQRFHVHGSGLPPEEITKYRVSAVVQVSEDRTVSGFSITPSGNATFDGAANSALESVKGQAIPPPPENYPDVKLTRIQVTFYCTEKKCD